MILNIKKEDNDMQCTSYHNFLHKKIPYLHALQENREMGARYLDPKYSRWMSTDPALGDYVPLAPINDEAKRHNSNLPGMGGVFNTVNMNLYHYAGNNPIKYTDPDGRETTLEDFAYKKRMKLNQAVRDNLNFTSSDSMACDKFVTKVLTDAGCLPKNWPDPDWTNVKGYRNFLKNDLSKIASGGWNIVIMISDNPIIELGGEVWKTDPTRVIIKSCGLAKIA